MKKRRYEWTKQYFLIINIAFYIFFLFMGYIYGSIDCCFLFEFIGEVDINFVFGLGLLTGLTILMSIDWLISISHKKYCKNCGIVLSMWYFTFKDGIYCKSCSYEKQLAAMRKLRKRK